MENNLMIFNNEEFGQIRMVEINGKVYGVGSDIAKSLGYKRPSEAITSHCKGTVKHRIPTNGGIQEVNIIPRGDMIRLIVKCTLEGADKFESWIFDEVIPQVLDTGKYDQQQQQIMLIEDKEERELTLGVYSLEQAQKSNPTDVTLSILIAQKKTELTQYKQQKQLNKIQEDIISIGSKTEEQSKKIDNIFVVGDRTQFNNEVKSVARATGESVNDIYSLTYKKLTDLYSIDLEARSKNRKKEIQTERTDSGRKPYSPETLNNKAGKLVIADEISCFAELGKSLNAVKNDLLK